MAYDPNNLSAGVYMNGFTLWHYRTKDSIDTVTEDGYFDDAAPMFKNGDFLIVNGKRKKRNQELPDNATMFIEVDGGNVFVELD